MRRRFWFFLTSAVALLAVVATVIVADTVNGSWAVDNNKRWVRVWANRSNPPNNHNLLVGITANQNSEGTVEVFQDTTPAQSGGVPTYPNPGPSHPHPPAMTQDITHGNSFTNTVSASEIWVCQNTPGGSGGGTQIADGSVNQAMVSSSWSADGESPLTLWSTTRKRICFTVSVDIGQSPVTVTVLDGVNTVTSLTAEDGTSVCLTAYATSIGIAPIDENASAGTFQYSIYDVFSEGD